MSGVVGPRLSTIPPTFFDDYSFKFDGSDDNIPIGTASLGITSSISVSAWVKIPTTNTGGPAPNIQEIICEDTTGGTQRNWGLFWRHISVANKYFQFSVFHTDGTATGIQSTGIVPNDGNWHHVMGTFDGTTNANGLKLYVDGTLFQTTAGSTGIRSTSTVEPSIGSLTNAGNWFFEGNIDEVSVWDSVQDISNVWDGNGKPIDITSTNPMVWYRMGDNATYRDPQWLLPNNENKDKASNYSMSFDGTNDYIDCGNIPEIKNNTEMTLSFWAKIEDMAFRILFGQNLVAGNDIFQLYLWGATPVLYMWIKNGGTGTVSYVDNATLTSLVSVGVWNHFTLVFNGSLTNDDRCKLFINGGGDAITNRGTMPTAFTNSDEPFLIGRGTNGYFQGNIDNVAVWDSDQSANVSTIYNGGIPSDLSSLNPINYYKMGENATYRGQWLLLSNENKDKFSNYSMSFDGTDDYITMGNPSELQITGNLTLSAWIKHPNPITNNNFICGRDNGSASRNYSIWSRSGTGVAFAIFKSGVFTYIADSVTTVDDGEWHHVMGVNDGTDLKLYIDGALKGTNSGGGGTIDNDVVDFTVGSYVVYSGDEFEGQIDGVAVFNSDKSGNISTIYNGGIPTDLSGESGLVGYWRMGEDATFSTNWTIPDQVGGNDGTSVNMDINDRVDDAPSSSGNTVSYNMDINDRVGDAPNSQNNILSANIPLSGRTTDVPT